MFDWHMTCRMCPEQYDIYYKGKLFAYFRIRYGKIYVHLYHYDENEQEYSIDWNEHVYFYQYEDNMKGWLDPDEMSEHKAKIEKILENYVRI